MQCSPILAHFSTIIRQGIEITELAPALKKGTAVHALCMVSSWVLSGIVELWAFFDYFNWLNSMSDAYIIDSWTAWSVIRYDYIYFQVIKAFDRACITGIRVDWDVCALNRSSRSKSNHECVWLSGCCSARSNLSLHICIGRVGRREGHGKNYDSGGWSVKCLIRWLINNSCAVVIQMSE